MAQRSTRGRVALVTIENAVGEPMPLVMVSFWRRASTLRFRVSVRS